MLKPRITVAVITYNRSRYLRKTLEGLALQNFPADQWELLVIDNNSTDDTRQVVGAFASAKPAPRFVLETRQGLDFGRNRAIDEAAGELLALIDDDIILEPDWLSQITSVFALEQGSRIGVVGGEVVPVFPDGLPKWLEGAHRPLNFRPDAGPLRPDESPMGANFAFPRAVFERFGKFDTQLDRHGASLFGGGDSEMVRRLRAGGLEAWFAPAARVLHQIPAGRLTFRYACRHGFDSARSRVVDRVRSLRQAGRSPAGYLASRALGSLVKVALFAAGALLGFAVLRTGPAKMALVRAWRACGYLYQIARSSFGKL